MKSKFLDIRALVVIVAAQLAAAAPAIASGTGGISKATGEMSAITIALYTLVGTCSTLYLLWLGVMCKLERKQWSDFGMGIFHVAIVGSVTALAPWAWAFLTS